MEATSCKSAKFEAACSGCATLCRNRSFAALANHEDLPVEKLNPLLMQSSLPNQQTSRNAIAFLYLVIGLLATVRAAQTYTWAGGASTGWLTASNWSPNGVPGADDTAIITSGSPQLPGDAVTLPHIQLVSGVLAGTGTITSSMIWSAGRIDGTLTIAAGGSLSITGASATHELANGGTINNLGTTTWSGGYIWRMATDPSSAACSINNMTGGVFEITGNNYAYVNNSKAWTFNNAGTVRKTGGTGLSSIEPTAFNHTGLIEVQTGTLQIGGPSSTASGLFSTTTGTRVVWSSGELANGASFTGLGAQEVKNATLNGNITASNLAITGTVSGNATLAGAGQLSGGTISGTLQLSGSLDWQSGRVDGTLTIAAGGSLGISGNQTNHEFANGGTLNNHGTTTWSGGYIWRLAADGSAATCTINNLADGVFEMTGNNYAYVNNNKAWIFNNAGIVRKKIGTATSQITPTAFNNTGTVESLTGTLELGGAGSASPGSFHAATGAVLTWISGAITDGANFTGSGEKRMNGGTLNGTVSCANLILAGSVGGSSTASGTVVLRGGTWTGTLEMTGSLDWQSGTVAGTISIASGGSLSISGTNLTHELANGGTINNHGTAIWSAGYIFRNATDASATTCSINNLTGGVFEITGNLSAYVNSKPWTFTNGGTVRKTGGTGTCQLLPSAFNNSGTVEAQIGTLQIGGAGSVSPGAFVANAGAFLNWTTGGITNGASFSGLGENRMSGGTLDGNITSTNLIIIGSVGGSSFVSGTAVLRGGTLTGTMEVSGSLDWQNGSVHGVLAIPNGGSLTISGTNFTHELADGGMVNNSGAVIWSGGYLLRTATDASTEDCSFNNLAGGIFEITANNLAYINAKPWSFNNQGTVRKTAGTGTCQIQPTAFNSSGIVESLVGTLQVGGVSSASSGSFIAGTGAIVAWTNGGITSGASFTGAGENRVNGGTIDGPVTSTNMVLAGNVGGNSTVSGTASLRGGTVAGSLEISGSLNWQSGAVHGTLSIASGGALTISGAGGSHELANGGVVNNSGTITWTDGYIFRTPTDVSGASCSINNLAGGVFDITSNSQAYINSKPWTFNNSGTVRKLSTGRTMIMITAFTNMATTGMIDVAAGILQFGNFNQTAGTVWVTGGNIECPDLQIQGGVLKGTHSVVGNVSQTGGQIQPGSGIGTLTITGNLTQSGSGALFSEIGGKTPGTSCDQLIVNGTATLGGSVSGTFVNGYVPRLGDEFTVLRYTTRSGAFAWMPFVVQLGRKMIPAICTSDVRLVTGLETMNFANWAEATGLTDLNSQLHADPEQDGMTNRLEYGLYLNPLVSDPNHGPAVSRSSNGGRLQISYQRINDTTDLDIEVEASSDMTNWQTIARSHHGGTTTDVEGGSFSISETVFPNYTNVTVVDQQIPSEAQSRRFLRVKVTDS